MPVFLTMCVSAARYQTLLSMFSVQFVVFLNPPLLFSVSKFHGTSFDQWNLGCASEMRQQTGYALAKGSASESNPGFPIQRKQFLSEENMFVWERQKHVSLCSLRKRNTSTAWLWWRLSAWMQMSSKRTFSAWEKQWLAASTQIIQPCLSNTTCMTGGQLLLFY